MIIPTGTTDKPTAFTTVVVKGIHWMIDPSYRRLIPDVMLAVLLHSRTSPDSRIIRENKVRRSMLIRIPQDREAVFAKLYKKPAGTDRIKYFLIPSKAAAEWKSLLQLYNRGLPVAPPLARGEKRRRGFLQEAYLFTGALEGASPLSEVVTGHDSLIRTKALVDQISHLVAEIHKQGFFYRDLHAGNLLILPDAGAGSSVYLVDFHKVWRTVWVPLWMRMRDLAQLHNSLLVSRTVRLRFLKSYFRHSGLPADSLGDVARRIDHQAKKMWSTHLKSRTKRCLRESSEYSIVAREAYTIFRNKVYSEALIDTLLTNYQRPVQGKPVILKKTTKETVSILRAIYGGEECEVVIKESRFRTFFGSLRHSLFGTRARRNWIGARALQVRGIETPDALALIEYRPMVLLRRTLLLTRYVEQSHELNEYVLKRYKRTLSAEVFRQKRQFIATLAGFIREMHARGVYHPDLKSNNILVREVGNTWRLYVVDLDRIRCRSSLSFKERANNLAQINASVASCITPADRMIFFKHYAQGSEMATERKKYFRRIMAIGRRKNTMPYGLIFKQT